VKVLVTGADGFVGRWMLRRLLADGHQVFGALRPTGASPDDGLTDGEREAVRWLPLELTNGESVRMAVDLPYDAVIHLAAVASGPDAARDPGFAWTVNAAGTARLTAVLGEARRLGRADPLVLIASTGEVYGRGQGGRPRVETDPLLPCSPYAASKVGAETAALEVWRRNGLRVIVARAFAHTGPGQDPRFVVPAFARRLRQAREIGAPAVKVGNLEPVREFLDVRDVVDAYVRLLERGEPGEVYNVAGGKGIGLRELFDRLSRLLDVRVIPETDPTLVRPADIPDLVGDGAKLRRATGWAPAHALDDTLRDTVDAQTD